MNFKIRVKGHVDKKWATRFDGLQITHETDGTSTLYGPIPDQSALHSILRKIRDLNLQLISVQQVNVDSLDETQAKPEGSDDPD